jgi:molybdopterin-guanine dinucleotide biosynthesis protein A
MTTLAHGPAVAGGSTAGLTGLVLAGGRGTRMGGLDKGLQLLHGVPLALHVLQRLRPQVAGMLISANRNLAHYRALGAPVVTDAQADSLGPLAGLLAGLRAAATPYVLCCPCDVPAVPLELGAVLLAACASTAAPIAYAITELAGAPPQRHPACALVACSLADDLAAFLSHGGRQVGAWYARHNAVEACFADERAFYNVNSLHELNGLEESAHVQHVVPPLP